jgi:putative phosphoesterase
MKIAVVSDTHNRTDRVLRAVAEIHDRRVRTVVHCGDVTDAPVVELFAGLDAHFVLGNCDHDDAALRHAIAAIGGTLHDGYGVLELAGKRLAFTHGHEYGRLQELKQSEAFDYLFHGHTHVAADHFAGTTRVINPGALQRVGVPTFVVLDLNSGEAETVEVGR